MCVSRRACLKDVLVGREVKGVHFALPAALPLVGAPPLAPPPEAPHGAYTVRLPSARVKATASTPARPTQASTLTGPAPAPEPR